MNLKEIKENFKQSHEGQKYRTKEVETFLSGLDYLSTEAIFADFEEKLKTTCTCGYEEVARYDYIHSCPKCGAGKTRRVLEFRKEEVKDDKRKIVHYFLIEHTLLSDGGFKTIFQGSICVVDGIIKYAGDSGWDYEEGFSRFDAKISTAYGPILRIAHYMGMKEPENSNIIDKHLQDEIHEYRVSTLEQKKSKQKNKKNKGVKSRNFLDYLSEETTGSHEPFAVLKDLENCIFVNDGKGVAKKYTYDESCLRYKTWKNKPIKFKSAIIDGQKYPVETMDIEGNIRVSGEKRKGKIILKDDTLLIIMYEMEDFYNVHENSYTEKISINHVVEYNILTGKYLIYNEKGSKTRKHLTSFYFPVTIEEENFEEVIKELRKREDRNYSLEYGLEVLYKNKSKEFPKFESREIIKQINAFIKVPALESMYKTGFTNIAESVLSQTSIDGENAYDGAKSLYDIIKIKDKNFVKYIRDNNTQLGTVMDLVNLYNIDSKSEIKLLEQLYGINRYHCEKVLKITKNAKRTLEYLENVLMYQCIDKRETLQILSDYYRMAEFIGYDFSNKNILYPQSLKKEHDIAVFTFNTMKKEYETKKFQQFTKTYKDLEYSDDEFSIVVPDKPSQVVNEGKRLHHCVATYVSAVSEQKTKILFLRKTDDMETPYITIEVSNRDAILQAKGMTNKKPDEKAVDFIEKWAKAKNLTSFY